VDGEFLVLVNKENQHSLWPAVVDIPVGWEVAHGRDSRQNCLDYVDAHWTDLRPASLIAEADRDLPEDRSPSSADTAEQTLCEMFATLLEREPVRADDDFFVLGGHSLLATRLINRVKDEFGVELSLQTMFENPTPAELAERLGEGRRARLALQARPRPDNGR
jgi:uncharacterized protein YbdZ (MbtH family)/acyl carrier protein